MNRFPKHNVLLILILALSCGLFGCTPKALEDAAETTNEVTDGVSENQYSVDPVDRIAD